MVRYSRPHLAKEYCMADRNSAEILGFVFEKLAELPASKDRDRIASEILKKSEEYDFTENQMNADEALRKLGLRRSF